MNTSLNRRSFLGSTTLVGASLAANSIARAQGGGKQLKAGLIGCGGRGNGAAKNWLEACKILGVDGKIVATADAFKEKAEKVGKQHGLAADRCFGGYEAYKALLETDCDFVLMATPPGFRPVHFAASVEAGKNIFIEKPVAVDPVGVRAVIKMGEVAKQKGLGVVAGTQRRHTKSYIDNKARIDAGAIGDIRGGVVQWNGRIPWIRRRKEGQSAADYMANNWLNFTELSGDHIVEQHVHNLDVAIWFLGRTPVSALGFGGRARRETGNQFDFFSVDLDFGDDVHIHSQCRQLAGTYSRVGEMFTGATGSTTGGGKMNGKDVKIPEVTVQSGNGQVQEHVDLIRSVLQDKPLNEARQVAESTMCAIIGRMSAYTGQMIRWKDVMENEKSEFFNYACAPAAIDFEKGPVKLPVEEPAVPGKA